MITRVLTAVALIAAIGLGIWLKGWTLRAILLICMLLCVDETYRALRRKGSHPLRWAGYLYCILAVGGQALSALNPGGLFGRVHPALFALAAGLMTAATAVVLIGQVDFDRLMSTVFPMFYPGLPFSLILTLQDLSSPRAATLALILAFFIASVSDTFALFIGVRFGRHRLSPEISPKKSMEGSVAGIVASVIFAVLVPVIAGAISPEPRPPLWAFALLGLCAGALSQIGDLTASLIKRHCGVKDYGALFPGHGGMMDRMDGILFCGVVCWAFFKMTGF